MLYSPISTFLVPKYGGKFVPPHFMGAHTYVIGKYVPGVPSLHLPLSIMAPKFPLYFGTKKVGIGKYIIFPQT